MKYSNVGIAKTMQAVCFLCTDKGDDHITFNLRIYSFSACWNVKLSSCSKFSYFPRNLHLSLDSKTEMESKTEIESCCASVCNPHILSLSKLLGQDKV